jgi:3'-phosphoadenosine 5'-phosphosulfate sulfotransferase (PAPS reductase)/FAD synthetase
MTMDPFKIDSPTCISFSGGRTSAYMLWRVLQSNNGLPAEAKVCFANTGKEDEATLRFVDRCSKEWDVSITWLEYQKETPKFKQVTFDTASRQGEPFADLIAAKKYLPNPVARFCTEELKVKAIERFLGNGEWETMVGVRADERVRVTKLRNRGLLLPLADVGISQSDVQDFWKSHSFNLELEFRNGITALGNCDLCFLKGPQQIAGLVKDKPQRAVWWAQQEQAVGATFRSDRPSYQKLHQFMVDQADMFNQEGTIDCFCGD